VFLDLSGNRIRDIADGAFTNLTNLEILRLQYNKIVNFEGNILSGLSSLKRLDVYGSGIVTLGSNVFRNLTSIEEIDLSYNRIRTVNSHTFVNLPALSKVSLRHNRISSIRLASFMGLHNFTYLHLSDNKLKYVREGAIIDVPNLETVFLFGNSLVCDCDAIWLYDFLKTRSLDTAFCAKPSALTGRRLIDILKLEFCGGPEFYVYPMPLRYVRAGQSIVLICGAAGTPSPQIFWSFEKTPIINSVRHVVTQSGDLIIRQTSHSDSGTYHCTASSIVGAIAASAEVIVGDAPKLNQSFSSRRLGEVGVAVGETAVILCPLEASPSPDYVWMFEGRKIDLSERILMTEDGTLVVVGVGEYDLGRYLCLAENPLGSDIYETDLIGLKKPSVETPLHNWIVDPQTNISFYCDIRGYESPSLSWYKDGILLARDGVLVETWTTAVPTIPTPHFIVTSKHNITGNNTRNETDPYNEDGSGMLIDTLTPLEATVTNVEDLRDRLEVSQEVLVIVEALKSDSGLYECRGVNSMGSASSSAYVLIGDFGYPNVSTYPKDLTAHPGETVSLYCNVTGYPEPSVKWIFNERVIYGDAYDIRSYVSPDNTLIMTDVQPFDEGYYDCQAESVGGYDSDSVYLTVESPPKFFELSNHTTVPGLENVLLHCVLDRNVKPPAKLTWYFSGKRLPDKSLPRHQPVNHEYLQIIDVRGSDAGLYACKAENNAGTIFHSFTLDVHVPVKISKGPMKTRSTIGSPAVFTCHAEGRPTPTIEWQINGVPVTNTSHQYLTHNHNLGVLTIVAVNRSDDDSIVTCVASAANQSIRAHARLEVKVPPFIVKEFGDNVFTKGSMGKLTCAFDGDPEPDVKWEKDGKDILGNPRYRITFGITSTLTINKLKAKDNGEYTCIASNPIGSVSSSGTVEVRAMPDSDGEPFMEKTLPIGGTAIFPCVATGLPKPTVEWVRDMTPLPDDPRYYTAKDGSLVILDVNVFDRGEFICVASNAAGSMIITTAKLDVQDRVSHPYISVCPLPQTVQLTEEAYFECSASGNPLPTIQWLHNGVAITNAMDGFNVTANGTLTIKNVTMSHMGEFTCVIENTEGNDSFVTSLTVTVPPTFTKQPNHTRKAIGSDVVFQCSADGIPKPTVLWTNSSFHELPFNDMRHFQLKDGGLLIRNVMKSDEGLYVCEAVNPLGRIMSTAELLVEGDSVNGTDDQLPKITWKIQPKNITVPEGQAAIIYCVVTSFPLATYAWSSNGSLLPGETTTDLFTTVNGSLVIDKVDYTNEGAYTCIASNGVMHLRHTVYLKILRPPYISYPPYSQVLHWTVVRTGNYSVEFSCEAVGYPAPTVEWLKDNQPIQDSRFTVSSNGHLTITPLAFEDAGDYTCIATNLAGVDRKTVSLLVQDNRPRDYCYSTVVYHHVRYGNCRTERKVDNFKCEGYCFSQEYPDQGNTSSEQIHCCRVHSVSMRNVKMTCPNNVTTTVRLPKVNECRCAVCAGSENSDMPVNEFD
jgi:hemicentin